MPDIAAWSMKQLAYEALANGELDKAVQLYEDLIARNYRKVWSLKNDIIKAFVRVGERHLRNDQISDAWATLKRVLKFAAEDDHGVNQFRTNLSKLKYSEIRAMLEVGKPDSAHAAFLELNELPIDQEPFAPLGDAARNWCHAIEKADSGDFSNARQLLERVRPVLNQRSSALDTFEVQLTQRAEQFDHALAALRQFLSIGSWNEVHTHATAVLQVAKFHREAQQAKSQAWEMLKLNAEPLEKHLGATALHVAVSTPKNSLEVTPQLVRPNEFRPPAKNYYLWIDGGSAFMICTQPRVTLGMATGGGTVDVPLFADVSRVHAALQRDSECYLLESGQSVRINDEPLEKAVLQSGDTLLLSNCQMCFDIPARGSLTARLMLNGNRRLSMAINGIILLSDMLEIGNHTQCHVQLEHATESMFITMRNGALHVHSKGRYRINDTLAQGVSAIHEPSHITCQDFSFALEPI